MFVPVVLVVGLATGVEVFGVVPFPSQCGGGGCWPLLSFLAVLLVLCSSKGACVSFIGKAAAMKRPAASKTEEPGNKKMKRPAGGCSSVLAHQDRIVTVAVSFQVRRSRRFRSRSPTRSRTPGL